MENSSTGIVCIPGTGLGSWIWRDVVPLIKTPMIAIDFPDQQTKKSFTLSDYVDVVMQKIEAWDVEKIIVVAHSSGGVISLKVAEALGERLIGLMEVSAVVPANGKSFLSTLPFFKRLAMKIGFRLIGTRPPKSAIKMLCSDLASSAADEMAERFIPESVHLYRDPTARAPKIPTVYVKLTNDVVLTPSMQETMISHLYAPTVITMHTGHMPMLKDPKHLAEIINEFVKTVKG